MPTEEQAPRPESRVEGAPEVPDCFREALRFFVASEVLVGWPPKCLPSAVPSGFLSNC